MLLKTTIAMRYTHLDQIVELYRESFNLPYWNPLVTTHMNVLDIRHEAFGKHGDTFSFRVMIVTIEDEKYTCFATDMVEQLHIVHEPSEHYDPLKPYDEPPLEDKINNLLQQMVGHRKTDKMEIASKLGFGERQLDDLIKTPDVKFVEVRSIAKACGFEIYIVPKELESKIKELNNYKSTI